MRLLISLLVLFINTSCFNTGVGGVGRSVTEIYLEDGSKGYKVDCNGSARNWGHCEESAGVKCGSQGYVVISRSDDRGDFATGSVNKSGGFATGGTMISRSMTIVCGK